MSPGCRHRFEVPSGIRCDVNILTFSERIVPCCRTVCQDQYTGL
ncbi:hypothetical protein [Azospirillum endophyticum]